MSSWMGIGVTSGPSLDGLDLCCVEFTGDYNTDTWSHRILHASTVPYSEGWHERLTTASEVSGSELIRMHADYGHYISTQVNKFIKENVISAKYVASHGHTIFHQPEYGFTFQLGDGETIVAALHLPLVTNFHNKDVALGGQGSPLVSVGETYLFSQYDMCMNLCGIANISVGDTGFDICPCNMLLNFLAEKSDEALKFDRDGAIAKKGIVVEEIRERLNALEYYSQPSPKSLSKEWFEENVLPIIVTQNHSAQDVMCTAVEHITDQIVKAIKTCIQDNPRVAGSPSLLVTGGGALNTFLMKRLYAKLESTDLHVGITESDEDTIQFKDALIYAFLGLRCLLGLPNINSGVTGACIDSVSGSIHLPPVNYSLTNNSCQDYRFHFRATVPGFVPPLLRRRISTLEDGNGVI